MFAMYFYFLKDQIINGSCENEETFNWNSANGKFVLIHTLSPEEIAHQEERLTAFGYHFPTELKAFWQEIGCGYLSPNDCIDNGLEEPHTALDIYFHEGDWADINLSCNIFAQNELPFLIINNSNYITIGLEEGVNQGKIYYLGEEIAPNLTYFIQQILKTVQWVHLLQE